MIDQSDVKLIDGEQYITGRAMARMTLASVLGEPKGQRADQCRSVGLLTRFNFWMNQTGFG